MLNKKVIFLMFVLLGAASNLFAQEKTSSNDLASNCEFVRHAIASSVVDTLKTESSNVIFIFRLGKGENSDEIISQRINDIKNYFKLSKIPDFNRFVMAKGEKTNGLGKLEIYVEGRLEYELFAKKNEVFGSDCLESPFN